jgi:ubiquinone/menaquinone biosynthesis C-methylase UbiE
VGLYAKYVLPHILDCACGTKPVRLQREKVVPKARGRVLEIGFGGGLNLPFYDPTEVDRIWALEPAAEMWALAEERADKSPVTIEHVAAGAEAIPLETGSADTVVSTFTLCTIPEPEIALAEIRRVLRPDGTLLFSEHGKAPDASVRKWQDRMNPLWGKIAGGCNINRDIRGLIAGAGFEIETLDTMYIPGWRPASFMTWGAAG